MIKDDTTSRAMIACYVGYSNYFSLKKDILNQLKYLLNAKRLAQNRDLVFINHNLSVVYQEIKAYNQALKISMENRKAAIVDKNPLDELYALQGLANIYLKLENYIAVKKVSFDAIKLKKKYNISPSFGSIYYVLGMVYFKENKLDSAKYYFNKGIEISQLQEEKETLGSNYFGMSELLFKKGEKQLAKQYAEKAKESFGSIVTNLNNLLAKCYAEENNYKKAYINLRENWNYREEEEGNRTEYKVISTLLNEKFEQEKKQKAEIFEQQLTQQRRIIAFIILSLLLIGISLFAFFQIRKNQQQKELYRQLSQRNEALKHFTYITSHDLKEPIRNIKSFTQLLQRKLKKRGDIEEQEYLDFISTGSNTLHLIVESLKVFTEVSFGEINQENIVLSNIFETVQNNLKTFLEKHQGEIYFENFDGIKNIFFSKRMLVIVLQNLIQNGVKFNQSTTPIVSITISKQGNQTLFKISDNGIGIQVEFFDKIFQPFKTLQNKSVIKSSGLGLAICKNIIENYGGTIWVESNGENGSQFYFRV